MRLVSTLGRAALGVPFVILGYDAAKDPGARAGMAAKIGVPEPEQAVRLNGAAMVAGGAALALGILPRTAAAGLAACLVPTTLAGHPFWEVEDPAARKAQQINFLKNLGLAGALAMYAAGGKV